jgi:predicted small metal-binding protein
MARRIVTCDCGFFAGSEDDDQLVAAMQQHVRQFHQMELTREQVLAMAQPEAAASQ